MRHLQVTLRILVILWFTSSIFSIAYADEDIIVPSEIAGEDLVTGKEVKVTFKDSIGIKKATSKKGTALVFLSVNCPCSNAHHKPIKELAEKFSKDGIEFIGIHSNANESIEVARKHFQNAEFNFSIIEDKGSKIADIFKADKTPHSFIVDPQLNVLFDGGVDSSSETPDKAKHHYLKDALEAVSNGKKPQDRKVRVLGCRIQRP